MKCSDIEAMLSAYANNEISETQKEMVEQHLVFCTECRSRLDEYIEVRQQLRLLKDTPGLESVSSSILSKIRRGGTNLTFRWLKPALISVPIAAAVITGLIIWQPWNSDNSSQGVIARAQTAISEVHSYRMSMVTTSYSEGQVTNTRISEIEFVDPDRYHFTMENEFLDLEYIVIGDQFYQKKSDSTLESGVGISSWSSSGYMYSSMITREYTAMMLGFLKNVKTLPEETVDGTVCLHYQGEYDYEQQLRAMQERRSKEGIRPLSEAEIIEQVEDWQSKIGSVVSELWVGKNDYLIRRMLSNTQGPDNSGNNPSSRTVYTFSDFNGQIVIEAPLDENGQLLAGWTSTVPEHPNISADIQVEVDNHDPSNREINYAIKLLNISTDNLTEVEVRIEAIISNPEPSKKIWHRWENGQYSNGPYRLTPGKTLEYVSTIGYDATVVSPQAIVKTVESSFIEINYTLPNGQRKAEVFHFEVPDSIYSLSTAIPPNLVPVALTPVGEYRVREESASDLGQGVSGEINGEKYLFVLVNTQNNETYTPPGILVLNIDDAANPHKTGYLSAPEGTGYLLSLVVSDNILYVSAENFLWVIDVSDPGSPVERARLTDLQPLSMVISGNYAFINDGNQDIISLDITKPSNPEKIGNLALPSKTWINLEISGHYLYIDAEDTFNIIDISSPASLKIVKQLTFDASLDTLNGLSPNIIWPYYTQGFSLAGERVYIALSGEAGTGILAMDISEPEKPRNIAFLKFEEQHLWGPIFTTNERLYVFTRNISGIDHKARIEFIDISQPASLSAIGFGILPDPWSFFEDFQNGSSSSYSMIDGYLYWFIGNAPNQPVIEIFDLSVQ